jgi:hypothetical protein
MTEFKTDAHLLQTTVIRSADLKTRIIKKDYLESLNNKKDVIAWWSGGIYDNPKLINKAIKELKNFLNENL